MSSATAGRTQLAASRKGAPVTRSGARRPDGNPVSSFLRGALAVFAATAFWCLPLGAARADSCSRGIYNSSSLTWSIVIVKHRGARWGDHHVTLKPGQSVRITYRNDVDFISYINYPYKRQSCRIPLAGYRVCKFDHAVPHIICTLGSRDKCRAYVAKHKIRGSAHHFVFNGWGKHDRGGNPSCYWVHRDRNTRHENVVLNSPANGDIRFIDR